MILLSKLERRTFWSSTVVGTSVHARKPHFALRPNPGLPGGNDWKTPVAAMEEVKHEHLVYDLKDNYLFKVRCGWGGWAAVGAPVRGSG
jgi:hypothetical protein